MIRTGLMITVNRIWTTLGRDKYDMFLLEQLPNLRWKVEFREKQKD